MLDISMTKSYISFRTNGKKNQVKNRRFCANPYEHANSSKIAFYSHGKEIKISIMITQSKEWDR